MLGILLFGAPGYRSLPVSDLPNVNYLTINVQVNLPAANADTMASAVQVDPQAMASMTWTAP